MKTGLEISLADLDYTLSEASVHQSFAIILQLRITQNPFHITVFTATINETESMGLGDFIDSGNISPSERATAGKMCVLCVASMPVDKTCKYICNEYL